MKRVLASGVFDILHPGHLFYLVKAKEHGEHLVVVVTSDAHAERSKRKPMHSEADRALMVEALDVVDEVLVGAEPYDLAGTTRRAQPDIIALGHDQSFDEQKLQDELAAAGIVVEVVRIPEHQRLTKRTRDILGEL